MNTPSSVKGNGMLLCSPHPETPRSTSFNSIASLKRSMEIELPPLDLPSDKVMVDLQWLIFECSKRCMTDTVKWATEILCFCRDELWDIYDDSDLELEVPPNLFEVTKEDRYTAFGRSLMQCGDIARASQYFKRVKDVDSVNNFLFYYTQLLAIEREILEDQAEAVERRPSAETHKMARKDYPKLTELHIILMREQTIEANSKQPQDPFMLYLLGRVEVALHNYELAIQHFTKCVVLEPRLWPAYEALVQNIHDRLQVEAVVGKYTTLKTHWMHYLFEMYGLDKTEHKRDSVKCGQRLLETPALGAQPMLQAQIGATLSSLCEHHEAKKYFESIVAVDPQRIDGMDIYSNVLFLLSERTELFRLASMFAVSHRFGWETCIFLSNYYALVGDHNTTMDFLERAVRINPSNSRCWTLIGHEYLELKNHGAACLAYRKALKLAPRDPAALFGLATLYDILNMQSFSLHFFTQAYNKSPQDTRLLYALACSLLKNEKYNDAKRCLIKMLQLGDYNSLIFADLGFLYEKAKDLAYAKKAYTKFIALTDNNEIEANHLSKVQHAILFLARSNLADGNFNDALSFANQAACYPGFSEQVREEARRIITTANERISEGLKLDESSSLNSSIDDAPARRTRSATRRSLEKLNASADNAMIVDDESDDFDDEDD